MKKNTIRLLCAGIALLCMNAAADPLDSVVKIFTVYSSPIYSLPWMDIPHEGSGSGCVIKGKRILTNAHVVSDQIMVLVRKQSSPDKFKAKVIAVAHDCDLALLEVEDESFFDDLAPLDIMTDLPSLQDPVFVLGYPEGGDTISFTQGVVSRIEVSPYTHSLIGLLALQIDAAINPGNSGGPVFNGQKLAGVVMQNLPQAQNIGYAVPGPIIHRFLHDVEQNGIFDGFGWLNIRTQTMESPSLRASKGMKAGQSGVLITYIVPAAAGMLPFKVGDVIAGFDGMDIANNGTVALRKGERVDWQYALSLKLSTESCRVTLLRDGKAMEVDVALMPRYVASGRPLYDIPPSYLIHGGLVFSPLTLNFMMETDSQDLWAEAARHDMHRPDEQIVILLNVLADDCNIGYSGLSSMVLKTLNGQPVINLKDLKAKIETSPDPYLTFGFAREFMIVLDAAAAREAGGRILTNYRIPSASSSDLAESPL